MNSSTCSPPPVVDPDEAEFDRRLTDLPKEVGVLLISVGVLGTLLPGVVGTPALVAGGLVLWPDRLRKVDDWLRRKAPRMHRESMKQINRFVSDLEKRYP